jgi:hypothetical protein
MRDWRGERGATPAVWLQCEVNTGGVTEEGALRGSTVVRLALPVKSRWSGRAGGLAQVSAHSPEPPRRRCLGSHSEHRGHSRSFESRNPEGSRGGRPHASPRPQPCHSVEPRG